MIPDQTEPAAQKPTLVQTALPMSPLFYSSTENGNPILTVEDAHFGLIKVVEEQGRYMATFQVELSDNEPPFLITVQAGCSDPSVLFPAFLYAVSVGTRKFVDAEGQTESPFPSSLMRWYWESQDSIDILRAALEDGNDFVNWTLRWRRGDPQDALHPAGNRLWILGRDSDLTDHTTGSFSILLFDGVWRNEDGTEIARPPAEWAYLPPGTRPYTKRIWPFPEVSNKDLT